MSLPSEIGAIQCLCVHHQVRLVRWRSDAQDRTTGLPESVPKVGTHPPGCPPGMTTTTTTTAPSGGGERYADLCAPDYLVITPWHVGPPWVARSDPSPAEKQPDGKLSTVKVMGNESFWWLLMSNDGYQWWLTMAKWIVMMHGLIALVMFLDHPDGKTKCSLMIHVQLKGRRVELQARRFAAKHLQ